MAYCTMEPRPVTPPPIMLFGTRKMIHPITYSSTPMVIRVYSFTQVQMFFLRSVMVRF